MPVAFEYDPRHNRARTAVSGVTVTVTTASALDVVSDRGAAHAIIAHATLAVCPGEAIGTEVEWFAHQSARRRTRLSENELRTALDSLPSNPLPHGGTVTLEPGGQIEISSAPAARTSEVIEAVRADATVLARHLSASGITLRSAAADVHRLPSRVLDAPRYQAMEAAFDRVGPLGRLMMCNTAAVQVCVNSGATASESQNRWDMLNAVGPALIATFAASPRIAGGVPGAWVSQRMRSWLFLDRQRTDFPQQHHSLSDYPEWALNTPLLCVRCDGKDWSAPPLTLGQWVDEGARSAIGRAPTVSDVEYHLTTLFPPVRPKGFFEVRYIDQQPSDQWHIPIAVVAALTSNPAVISQARDIAEETARWWLRAARLGLTEPAVKRASRRLLALAAEHADSPELAREIDTFAGQRTCHPSPTVGAR
ncbi:ergothioneine biosynthesis glutamate--cysteine ligase EgtA [Hoyosella rhizosphaerae]|uniref:glutamate-cysteine ligase family protein n=1 Tax=Hoyosella rhizosphaerae TaxID=1755582 RepID=UPI00166E64F7|nr:glutamate-cysteine ligase family protein [Hoyosella rhizosphaerae]MBN4926778.1 ergothioneine biosynthesis glutamate--cysteine ligase EgtA [Hoyosella rhizosphaerae]